MRLPVKVIPGSSRNQIVGWLGQDLKITVTAPAQADKANKAVLVLLAKRLLIEKKAIEIIAGHRSVRKIVEIRVNNEDEVFKQLNQYSKQA